MQIGETVRDYVLEEKIGAGGVGEVWRARHLALDKIVAVKFMFAHLAQDPDFQDRFLREAVTMANLDHPNIVSVSDYFSSEGQHCLVMSHVDCGSLRDWIREKSRFSEAETLQIAGQMLSALDFAHRRGVIHRDVKPSNILMDLNGNAHLTDFGIVLLTSEQRLTTTGTFMGTVEYMSPEQIQAVKGVTGRSDQYSCACVLYEMLTGQPPCGSRDGGDTEFTIMKRHTDEIPPIIRELNPDVSEATQAAIMQALAKDPANRFPSCGDMIRALELSQVQPHVSGSTVPPGVIDRAVSDQTSAIVVPKALSDKAISNRKSDIHVPKLTPDSGDTMVSVQNKAVYPTTEKLSPADVVQAQTQTPLAPTQVVQAEATKAVGKKSYALWLVLAIVAGSALSFLSLKDTFTVRSLLGKAEKAYAMGEYEAPQGSSALDYYKKVLQLEPDNKKAINGIRRMADYYLNLSKKAVGERQYAKSERYADDAARLAQLHPQLNGITDRVAAEQKIRVAEMALEEVESEKLKIKAMEQEQLDQLEQEKERLASEKERLSTERIIMQNEKRLLTQSRLNTQQPVPQARTVSGSKDAAARSPAAKEAKLIKPITMSVVKKKATTASASKGLNTAKTKIPQRNQTVATAKPEPKPEPVPASVKTEAEINAELKQHYNTGRAMLKKRDMTLADIREAQGLLKQMQGLSAEHKLVKSLSTLIVRACYLLGRNTLKQKQYETTQELIKLGLGLDADDKRMKKLQKLLDRQRQ
ncbi:MAG: protein kinase [Gammaproteobacteria bacterium]|nr:protein kinase [Gammaproteobacteria bacterium]MDH5801274.1 protein kinase [Gammaproteobacteria bacterium]